MTRARGTADRFRDLVQRRLLPGLADLGLDARLPGSLAAAEAHGVVWLVDLDVAPWSTPQKVCFAVEWGVHVPGLDEAVGDPVPDIPTVDVCPVRGRLGERPGLREPRWFELRQLPRPAVGVADASLAGHVLGGIQDEVMPVLERLSTPVEVQRHLHAGLVTGRRAPDPLELRTIRRIAALSLLLGDRANASRWLDHLETRSATAMAPDIVAERLAPLRQLIAS